VTLFDPITVLFQQIEDNPLDETARQEYESLLRSRSPNSREVRFLELDRQLGDAAEKPERFTSILTALGELQRSEFDWDDRLWTYVMPRRFDLWLDAFQPALTLAVSNGLRICGEFAAEVDAANTPLIIARQQPALGLQSLRSRILLFICRYERRSDTEDELSCDEMQMTIRPAWTKRGE
jgi:hypothetical protein